MYIYPPQDERGRRQLEYEVSCLSVNPLRLRKSEEGEGGEGDRMEEEEVSKSIYLRIYMCVYITYINMDEPSTHPHTLPPHTHHQTTDPPPHLLPLGGGGAVDGRVSAPARPPLPRASRLLCPGGRYAGEDIFMCVYMYQYILYLNKITLPH